MRELSAEIKDNREKGPDQAIRCDYVCDIYSALQGKVQNCAIYLIYLRNRMSSAVCKVGIIGIINTNKLDGRCVKTIVFTIPNFVAMGLPKGKVGKETLGIQGTSRQQWYIHTQKLRRRFQQ